MYSYEWDIETGGYILNNNQLAFSKEPRPVYPKEMDLLGFCDYFEYDDDDRPILWAETNNYFYHGVLIAKTKGGSLFSNPKLQIVDDSLVGKKLNPVDLALMVAKNDSIMEALVQETIKKIYNTYIKYKDKVDVFYVAFSGGKDSVVALDLVQRALPHNAFKVVFGDTKMECSDTYECIEQVKDYCNKREISFLTATSELSTDESWKSFGPPAVTIRWCCSVHKTTPQIKLLKKETGMDSFTGMAFTGVRGDESTARSEYDDISFGGKHKGQYSCHVILDWNSAELFNYIYQEKLILNRAYKRGNSRVGCLVCPMSSGKHEFVKYQCYSEDIDRFVNNIMLTSAKKDFTKKDMIQFIDAGNWKTRKSGRELNFGYDLHVFQIVNGKTQIKVSGEIDNWKEWIKTIGRLIETENGKYSIEYNDKIYKINLDEKDKERVFTFPNIDSTRVDIKFLSLFKSVIIKSLYCVNCGVCEANCPFGCLSIDRDGVKVSSNCRHCHLCHDIQEHCLRYNSIRNKAGGKKGKMSGIDRYFSFGIKKDWIDLYFHENGSAEFWDSDGNGKVPNKKKDAFLNFLKDAEMVSVDKSIDGDKYTKCIPTNFAKKMFELGSNSDLSWAFMLCNLVYTPQFNWYVKNLSFRKTYTPELIKLMLEEVMENDAKGKGKRNVIDSLKMILIKTPIGSNLGLGKCAYDEKYNAAGNETITLKSFYRDSWNDVNPLVVLYSLFKYVEQSENKYYQFTLGSLTNYQSDIEAISPAQIFGLDRDDLEKIINGLAVNYKDYIKASFSLDLDTISLAKDKTSLDVLDLL